MKIRMIAFDMDGTLLDDRKEIPPENLRELDRAAGMGTLIVPATGRIYTGLPEAIRALPYMRYFLTVNGAYVYDAVEDRILRRCELSAALSLRLIAYADTLPVLYDCYQDNWGYMSRHMLDRVAEYMDDPGILNLIRTLRTPVDDLSETIAQRGRPLQKLQLYLKDISRKAEMMDEISRLFPEVSVTSSVPHNIEINSAEATKGQALSALCEHVGLPLEAVMALGDGSNDTDMLRAAGLGVAMANAPEGVKAAADYVTLSNNEAGVAAAIKKFLI